jgi:imidazole glycerol-phosphate synthase subunit HisF
MKRPRIIPVLLINRSGVVKSTRFKDFTYIGDPINAVRIFNELQVDELVLLDIDATKEKRSISLDLVKEIGEEANMPFSVGGGIQSVATIREIIQAGAEKVVLNTAAFLQPEFLKEAVTHFGSSTISVCIDYKKGLLSKERVYVKNGQEKIHFTPIEAAKYAEQQGAGEIVIQSIDRDGTMQGYDLELIKTINESVTIPVVALGGAGQQQDLETLYKTTPVNGLAAGSYFVFQAPLKGVLIQYPKITRYNFFK